VNTSPGTSSPIWTPLRTLGASRYKDEKYIKCFEIDLSKLSLFFSSLKISNFHFQTLEERDVVQIDRLSIPFNKEMLYVKFIYGVATHTGPILQQKKSILRFSLTFKIDQYFQEWKKDILFRNFSASIFKSSSKNLVNIIS
jgi:hypothetical protein